MALASLTQFPDSLAEEYHLGQPWVCSSCLLPLQYATIKGIFCNSMSARHLLTFFFLFCHVFPNTIQLHLLLQFLLMTLWAFFSLIMLRFLTHGLLPWIYSNCFSVSPRVGICFDLNKRFFCLFALLTVANDLAYDMLLLSIHLYPFLATYVRSFAWKRLQSFAGKA